MNRTKTERLLDNLCVELGFCLPPDEYIRLSNTHAHSATFFTNAIFSAEELDPVVADKKLWRQVHDQVAEFLINEDADN